jgi:hypothetical protein
MALDHTGKVIVIVMVAAVVAISVFAAGAFFPKQSSNVNSQTSSVPISSLGSRTTESSALATTQLFGIDPASCHGNCIIDNPWTSGSQLHKTLNDLVASGFVLVGNVTSLSTVAVKGVPVTVYNVTIVLMINPIGHTNLGPGSVLKVAQVGGTAAGNTMTLKGYPLLVKGGTYVFFLNLPGGTVAPNCGNNCYLISDPTAPYVGGVDNGFAFVTAGGPQGVFSVQGSKVYSLDNLYPQDDAWLPLKVSGVPLTQFITEIQQAVSSTTSTTT